MCVCILYQLNMHPFCCFTQVSKVMCAYRHNECVCNTVHVHICHLHTYVHALYLAFRLLLVITIVLL